MNTPLATDEELRSLAEDMVRFCPQLTRLCLGDGGDGEIELGSEVWCIDEGCYAVVSKITDFGDSILYELVFEDGEVGEYPRESLELSN